MSGGIHYDLKADGSWTMTQTDNDGKVVRRSSAPAVGTTEWRVLNLDVLEPVRLRIDLPAGQVRGSHVAAYLALIIAVAGLFIR